MKKCILIMAAGTGGHVFPALAVAKALQEHAVEVAWLGTKKGLENKLLAGTQIPFYSISISGIRGHGLRRRLFAPFKIFWAFVQTLLIIWRVKPDAVLGMGGFVCGPAGLAAWVLRKKLILHEQNAVPGLTNKLLSHYATVILTAFPSVLLSQKTHYVGNPIRHEIADIPAPEARLAHRTGRPIRVLIFGGSLGAHSFSEVLPKAFALLKPEMSFEIWHQAGERGFEIAQQNYKECVISAKIVPFIDDMAGAYEWADFVICRAGASTVSEIGAAGLAALFVPYPFHKDDQQAYNARFLVEAKAAEMMRQVDFTPENVVRKIREVFMNRKQLLCMAQAGRALRRVDATQKIVEILL